MVEIIFGFEQELRSWFEQNYKLLGYSRIIKNNKTKFPDFIMEKDNKSVRVELEVFSSDFIKHRHKFENVDEIICVINDMHLPVKTISVNNYVAMWYDAGIYPLSENLIDIDNLPEKKDVPTEEQTKYEYYLGLRLSEKERNIILKIKKQLEERDKREYSISETVRNILWEGFSKYGKFA